MKESISKLAHDLKFGSDAIWSLESYGLQYRKGKTSTDIRHAYIKAHRFNTGRGKTEYELEFLELYLESVVKRLYKRGNT